MWRFAVARSQLILWTSRKSSFVFWNGVLYFPWNLSCRIFCQCFINPGLQQSVQLILLFGFMQHHRAITFVCLKNPNIFVKPQKFYGFRLLFSYVRPGRFRLL
jgi:hypothetical protein